MNTKYFLLILLLYLSGSCANNNSNQKNNSKYQENNEISDSVSDINLQLLPIIKEVIDSNENKIRFRPEIGYKEYFYCLRFFKQEEFLYISTWVCWSFPFSQFYNDALFSYDTSCIYYFNLFNRNIIIMDSPENGEHNLFQKSKKRNIIAMQKKKEIELLLSKHPPMMSDRETYKRTFIVISNNSSISIKPIEEIIHSPPYISEKQSLTPIIDE
ncbi:MAG: hypothetical protein GX259_09935 [Bacteroidales bacterium]|jgi:hypothetical protein|nr:hypothetical protein [Bacteroidales bacterium]